MPVSQDAEASKPLCDEEIEELNNILYGLPNEEAMSLEMVDGFFTALHCSPSIVTPNVFLHKVCGDDDENEMSFEDEEQFYLFVKLLMRYWNEVGIQLRNKAFVPFLYSTPDRGTAWSIGFVHGVILAEGNLESMMRDEEEKMTFMVILMLAFADNDLQDDDLPPLFNKEVTPEFREELLKCLPIAAAFLYARFHRKSISEMLGIASSGKLGRNDLCICGSGKKYKKCCLQKLCLKRAT
ncbi:MAG: UPF0149 family protein [Holosporaceae bacterium]|jgi:uncharacterized protein|nr:UPF0149 family protein [Holosporaceae bacterium]